MKGSAAGLLLIALAAPAAAQTPADALSFLVTDQSVQTGDFQKDAAAAAATRDAIQRALVASLSAAPIATSSSGFVYRLDPQLGTATRASDSFGTFFVERALTAGGGRTTFGASAASASYGSLDGRSLTDGTLVTTANQFNDESAPFDVETLTLRIHTDTLTIFGSYGVTDRLEVGAVVPFVRLHLEGSRINVYRGQTFTQATASADASGLADAAVRGKYQLIARPHGAIAAEAELRLPTGSETSLLGSGTAGVRFTGIASYEEQHWGIHGNFGIARGGASAEVDASGAVSYAVNPRVTAVGELLIRRLSDVHELVPLSAPHPTISGVDTLRLIPGAQVSALSSVVTGVKWNVTSTVVLSGHVLWRIGGAGLTARATPAISADYLF